MNVSVTAICRRCVRALVLLSLLISAPLAAQPAALTSPGISHGYNFPRSKQGVSDLYN